MGLRAGDVITEAGQQKVTSISDFETRLEEVKDAGRKSLLLLVRRDFVAMYKQTILGPLWFIIQPVMTTLVFTLVFGNIAGISTDGLPKLLFYLSGITCWNYFAESLTKTSETFTANANIFGKVYFPRIIIPLSIVVSGLLKLTVQFALFLVFAGWFYFQGADFGLICLNVAMRSWPYFSCPV